VCLGKRRHGRAPLLLWAPSPRVEANPWASGLDFRARSSLGTLARLLLFATASTIVAAAALALATVVGLRRGRGRRAAGCRGAGRRHGGSEGGVGGNLVVVGEAEFLQAEHVHRLGEGRQWPRVGDDIDGVGEARVDAVQQVEHQLTI